MSEYGEFMPGARAPATGSPCSATVGSGGAAPERSVSVRLAEREVIATTLRNVWPSLPALSVASAAICLVAVVPVLVAPGLNPLAVLVAAVCLGPFAAALVAVVNQMAADDHGTLGTWACTLRHRWRFAVANALVLAVPSALFITALHVLDVTGAVWVWPSVALSGGVAVLAALGLCAVIPVGLVTPQLRPGALWAGALGLVAARPARFVAVTTSVGSVVWLASRMTASLLLFAPAPAAIVAVAATWTTVVAVGGVAPADRRAGDCAGHRDRAHDDAGARDPFYAPPRGVPSR